ncbi:MAG: helix-turn-helix domain-containing protein [Pseudomonadota bacterium]
MHETIRANIRALMEQHGLTENALATGANIVQSRLHRYLKGETEDPGYSAIRAIADYFGMSVGELDGTAARAYTPDPKIRAVLLAMEQMPEYKKDALVAASSSLAEHPKPATDADHDRDDNHKAA